MHQHDFEREVTAAGLQPRICNPAHWQIQGSKTLVHCYPHTRQGFKFCAEGEKSKPGTLRVAIFAAGPPQKPKRESEESFSVHHPEPPWESQRVGLIRWLWRKLW